MFDRANYAGKHELPVEMIVAKKSVIEGIPVGEAALSVAEKYRNSVVPRTVFGGVVGSVFGGVVGSALFSLATSSNETAAGAVAGAVVGSVALGLISHFSTKRRESQARQIAETHGYSQS